LHFTEVTSTFTSSEGELVSIENAITPQEAFAVQSLGRCTRKVLPLDLPFYHKRAFGLAHQIDNEGDHLQSGNVCTYLSGLLQMFAPGVAAQLPKIAVAAWEVADWGGEHFGHMPDPRKTGIRTTEHLYYETTSQLGVHIDGGSNYTVVISLSDPREYEGGQFRLLSDNVMFKPNKFTAIVFRSEIMHGVEPITSGKRETFATELWPLVDTPAGLAKPSPETMFGLVAEGDVAEGEYQFPQILYEVEDPVTDPSELCPAGDSSTSWLM
jgi:hypothetical protein